MSSEEEILRQLTRMTAALESMTSGVSSATDSTLKFAEGMTEAEKSAALAKSIVQKAEKAAHDRLEKAMNESIRSVASFGKALTSGAEGGFSKFSGGTEQAVNALATLASGLGRYGKVLEATIQIAGRLLTAQMKQADDILKTSDAIKNLGNAGVLSTAAVMKMTHDAGLTAAQSIKLTDAMKKAGSGVVGLGDKFGDGVKAFGSMVAVSNETREGFRNLGISGDELMGYQGEYLALQKASGMQMSKQGKDAEGLRKASTDYVRNLVELSSISGNDLETTQKNIKAEKERYEYVLANAMQQREIDKATASGDKEKVKQLTEEMEARDKLIKSTSQYLNESDKAGLAMFLTTGAYTEASAKYATAGVDMDGFREKIKAGKDVTAEFQQAIKDATGRQMDQLGTAALYNASLRDSTLLGKENIQMTMARKGIDEEKFKKEAEAARKAQEADAKGDPAEKTRNSVETFARETAVAIDKFVNKFNPFTEGFTVATAAMTLLGVAAGVAAAALTLLAGTKAAGALLSSLRGGGAAAGGAAAGGAAAGGAAGAAAAAAGVLAAGVGGYAIGTVLNDTFNISDTIVDMLMASQDKKVEESLKSVPAKVAAEPIAMGNEGRRTAMAPTAAAEPIAMGNEGRRTAGAPAAAAEPVAMGNEGRRTAGAPAAAAAPVAMGNEGNRTARKSATLTPQPPEGAGAVEATKTIALGSILKFGKGSGSQQNFEGLTPGMKDAVIAAATEYNSATGGKFQINSAKRDPEDQKRLWDESVAAGRPGKGPTGMAIGKPGRSLHERGEAVDIQNYKDPAAVAAMNNQGLSQKVPGDPVHFQARNGGVFTGSNSGYPVTLHGREAVVPMPDPSSKLKVEKNELASVTTNNSNSVSESTTTNNMFADLMEMMSAKLDSVINKLADSNDTQEKLLMYSRV